MADAANFGSLERHHARAPSDVALTELIAGAGVGFHDEATIPLENGSEAPTADHIVQYGVASLSGRSQWAFEAALVR